jgi:hypothetical protein
LTARTGRRRACLAGDVVTDAFFSERISKRRSKIRRHPCRVRASAAVVPRSCGSGFIVSVGVLVDNLGIRTLLVPAPPIDAGRRIG